MSNAAIGHSYVPDAFPRVVPERDCSLDGTSPPKPCALVGVHEAAHRMLAPLPRGRMLDVGAGRGALSYWAQQQGFDVTALDIDQGLFELKSVRFVCADLNERFPVSDQSADVVVALEIIEHLENPFLFLRELARVVRPGGHVILSTPNEHNVLNRWSYFWTGFYGDSRHVLWEDDPDLPMKHIHMVPPSQLELAWRRAGLRFVDLQVSRYRSVAWMLWPIVYPVQALRYLIRQRKQTRGVQRNTTRQVYHLLNDVRLMLGRVAVYHLERPGTETAQPLGRRA